MNVCSFTKLQTVAILILCIYYIRFQTLRLHAICKMRVTFPYIAPNCLAMPQKMRERLRWPFICAKFSMNLRMGGFQQNFRQVKFCNLSHLQNFSALFLETLKPIRELMQAIAMPGYTRMLVSLYCCYQRYRQWPS